MAIRIKQGDAWQDPEDILISGSDGVMESAKVVRAQQEYGVWADVWPDKTYLIKNGNTTTLAGKYQTYVYRDSEHYNSAHGGVMPIVNEDTVFAVSISRVSSLKHGIGTVFWVIPIDITQYRKLCIQMAGNLSDLPIGGGWAKIGFTKTITDNYSLISVHIDHYNNGTAEMDIETLTGNYYLTIEVCGSSALEISYTFKIADIWLEK